MRVKKLNANRRHKAGEDEAVAAGGDSEQRRWVSPTKPLRTAGTGSNSGSSSPTDVQQHQHLGDHSPLYGGAGGVAVMPNAASDVVMQEEEPADRNPMRRAVIDRIVETLRAMKPHAPEKVLAALPRLAQHMEKTLFKLAKNEAEYCDQSTLKLRIAHIQESNAKRLLAQQQPQTPENNNNSALTPLTEEQARVVFQHLQCWRQKLVNMYGVAPWEILPNPTLAKVALYMPSTEQELVVCGVDNDKMARFGSSLVQELQRLRGGSPPSKPGTRPIKAKPGRKPSSNKRGASESLAGAAKKRKNGEAARLAPAAPAPSYNGTPLVSAAPLLPAVDSLPTLLPTVSMIPPGSASAVSKSMARLSPGQQQQPFLTRLQPQQQGSPSPAQDNHMHLLVQGAGQMSKQQNAKSPEAYEHELQSLRWMLHQSQQEKAQLEMEIQRLRGELQGRSK